jgi:hypothetical protein
MKNSFKLILITIIVLSLVLIFTIFISKCLKASQKVNVYSTLCSISAALREGIYKENPVIIEVLQDANNVWKSLNDEQYDKVICEIQKFHDIDFSGVGKFDKILFDPWGNRLVICYIKLNNKYDIMIVSKGPDRKYGTKDDITSQYGILPPGLGI